MVNLDLASFAQQQMRIGRSRDWRLPSVLFCLLAAMFVAHIARMHTITHDAFHEMALVRAWFRTGVFPTQDVFAFTPTVAPAVHHEWATGLILYLSSGDHPWGWQGMAVLKWSLMIGLWAMMYRVARQNGAHPILFAIMAPIAFPMLWVGFATVRAGLFTMCAIAAQLLMQQSDARGRRGWMVLWIPMYVAWLNIHAGFVVGVAMMGLHGIERSWIAIQQAHPKTRSLTWSEWWRTLATGRVISFWWRSTWHLLALVPVILIGTLINPWGTDYLPYLVRAISMPRPTMLEWNPLWYTHDPGTTLVAYALCVGALVYAACNRSSMRLGGFLICALAAYMALKHIRHGALFGVLWISLVPGWLSPTPLGQSLLRLVQGNAKWVVRVAIVVMSACGLFAMQHPFYKATIPDRPSATQQCYPVGAVRYLRESGFRGNLLTPFDCGSYVSWELHPRVLVSVDGRYEVAYQEHVLPQHNRFFKVEAGWEKVPEEFGAEAILVPTRTKVCDALLDGASEPGDRRWRAEYRDAHYVVFTRLRKSPSACGGSVVSATGKAVLKSMDYVLSNNSQRPRRSSLATLLKESNNMFPFNSFQDVDIRANSPIQSVSEVIESRR